ncbi:unnamed protein product [Ectocarpus sp. 4 AP-2014]
MARPVASVNIYTVLHGTRFSLSARNHGAPVCVEIHHSSGWWYIILRTIQCFLPCHATSLTSTRFVHTSDVWHWSWTRTGTFSEDTNTHAGMKRGEVGYLRACRPQNIRSQMYNTVGNHQGGGTDFKSASANQRSPIKHGWRLGYFLLQ